MITKCLLTACSLLFINLQAKAAIVNFDLVLLPSSEHVQYHDGYLRGPGSIDISDLNFTAQSKSLKHDLDDKYMVGDDGYRRVQLHDATLQHRTLDGGVEHDAFYVDIAIFPLPSSCAQSKKGCDWSSLGVGKKSINGEFRWCCSEEAINLGLCQKSEQTFGRLILDDEKFQGVHRFLSFPAGGEMSKHLRYGKVEEEKSGTFRVLYALCNENGREISIKGKAIWTSKHGYLPGELFGFMYFNIFITLVYASCFGWFAFLMQQHKESRIEIEKWIIFAIGLGFFEMFFRSLDCYFWNAKGYRSSIIILIGIVLGVFKQGVSRCLAVMVSMGWGVTCESISNTARVACIGLAGIYIFISAVSDASVTLAEEKLSKLSYAKENGIVSLVGILGWLSSLLNTIIIVWVFIALNKTLRYLESNNEQVKSIRMQHVRKIFVSAVLLALAWIVFSFFDHYGESSIIAEEHSWTKDAASEVNYLFVLVAIAILWKPNETAPHYAYLKQLSSICYDDEADELELSDMNV